MSKLIQRMYTPSRQWDRVVSDSDVAHGAPGKSSSKSFRPLYPTQFCRNYGIEPLRARNILHPLELQLQSRRLWTRVTRTS